MTKDFTSTCILPLSCLMSARVVDIWQNDAGMDIVRLETHFLAMCPSSKRLITGITDKIPLTPIGRPGQNPLMQKQQGDCAHVFTFEPFWAEGILSGYPVTDLIPPAYAPLVLVSGFPWAMSHLWEGNQMYSCTCTHILCLLGSISVKILHFP